MLSRRTCRNLVRTKEEGTKFLSSLFRMRRQIMPMYMKSFPRSILITWRRLMVSSSTKRLISSRKKSGHGPRFADTCGDKAGQTQVKGRFRRCSPSLPASE